MYDFTVRELYNIHPEEELARIGFDSSYTFKATDKLKFKLVKIYSLTPAQSNILKQTALSVGADCMTHRDVITGKIEKSDVIICATTSELKKISRKLIFQPFGLKVLAERLINLCSSDSVLRQTKIVGILNITDNSFSDAGMYLDIDAAKKHLMEMVIEGADGIDIGAESTKPYSSPIDADIQLKRILPILDFIQKEKLELPISIDTRSSKVAEEVLKRGNYLINDVSGFEYDKKMPEVISKYNASIIIQHSKGSPENMQINPVYDNVVEEIYMALKEKINFANSLGIKNIIIDPGIGFGKTKANNLEILLKIEDFYSLNCPVMVGVSRKSFIDADSLVDKDMYTLAFNSRLIEKGVDYLRVHNVKIHKEFLNNFIR